MRRRPEGVNTILMVGAVVLLNSTKMLMVGVFVVFMHDYGLALPRECIK